jgi:hypothetical protein
MALNLPTLDELRRRRAAVNAVVGRKLIPRIIAASLAQLALFLLVFVNAGALADRNMVLPMLLGATALSTVVALWLIVLWRPRLLAKLAAEDGLLCHQCGAPLLLPMTRARADAALTRGGLTPQHYLVEGHCAKCGAAVVSELQHLPAPNARAG